MFQYHAFGLKLESEVALPELHHGSGPADVSIAFATIGAEEGSDKERWFDGGGDRVTLRLEGIRFEVKGGRSIRIAALACGGAGRVRRERVHGH